jgi:small-conductance mechanosensitive channel
MSLVELPLANVWTENRNSITAIVTVAIAVGLARFVDAYVVKRATRAARAVAGPLSPVATTRIRLVRRIITAAIVLIGVMLALSQFDSVKRTATGVLASSALLGIILGFAARQTLANAIAGILLAITQPIRIGDLVTIEGQTGIVEDIRLTYTYILADDGRRIIVPNERLAENTIDNHTIVDPRVRVQIDVWVAPDADVLRALKLLSAGDEIDASVAEIDKDAVRIQVGTWARTSAERGPLAAGLRASALETLRREGLSSNPAG